jgi:DNA polymerase III alpha subunit
MGKLMPDTYGVMVYQEDVLTVAHELAGISYGKADIMRRAMSGKARDHERVSDLKLDFIRGCVQNNITESVALEIWRQIESFSGYSFCKAHSASYAVLSFQEAWLKVYHPAEFLCNVLNNQGGYYRHQDYINECRLLGVTVLLPDVNKSGYWHTVEADKTIRLGFVAFKDLSQNSMETMLKNRDEGGAYRSVDDFTKRSGVTPEDGKLLIELGALDSLGVDRPRANLRFAASVKRSDPRRHGQHSLDFPEQPFLYDLSHIHSYERLYCFRRERACFGYSVSDLPFDFLTPYLEGAAPGAEIEKYVGKEITVVAAIATSKVVSTKKSQMMLMLNLSDASGMFDVVIWPEEFQKYYQVFSNAEALRITGKVAASFDVPVLEARTIERLEFVEETKGTAAARAA